MPLWSKSDLHKLLKQLIFVIGRLDFHIHQASCPNYFTLLTGHSSHMTGDHANWPVVFSKAKACRRHPSLVHSFYCRDRRWLLPFWGIEGFLTWPDKTISLTSVFSISLKLVAQTISLHYQVMPLICPVMMQPDLLDFLISTTHRSDH